MQPDERIRNRIEIEDAVTELFDKDIRIGLGANFEGTVQPISHPGDEVATYTNGKSGRIVAWEFDGTTIGGDDGTTTFRGIGPIPAGTSVHFWGVHIFDAESEQVLRIIDDTTVRAQLGIVDSGRPIANIEPFRGKGD